VENKNSFIKKMKSIQIDNDTTPLSPISTSTPSNSNEIITCTVPKFYWEPPVDAATHPYRPHAGEGSQYLRDFILGVNDGLVSTFLLVIGIIGGGGSAKTALLTGLSSAIAGACAMGIGEYIATKSQTAVTKGDLYLEREHFVHHRDVELKQLRTFWSAMSVDGELLEAIVAEVGRSDDALMQMMKAFEFGISSEETMHRHPIAAMAMSGRLFFIGSLPTIVPFMFTNDIHVGMIGAIILVLVTLFCVGAYKTRTTHGNPIYSGLENLLFGTIGAVCSYSVGIFIAYVSHGTVHVVTA
jgi:VIT1/CCC1 family predicted Fe2+/Mn2+ transporter